MAPSFPPDIVARIKDETDIVEVVRQYVTLRPAGTSFKGLCPFHTEKTPSFHVNSVRQIYKCFGCGEGGDVISFLQAIEAISFPEAVEALARPLDIDLARYLREDDGDGERRSFLRANEVASRLWTDALWDERNGQRARTYLAGRGLADETLHRFDVGYAPAGTGWLAAGLQREGVSQELALRAGLLKEGKGSEPFAYFRNRIIFPVRNISKQITGFGGRVVDQGEPKYLNSPDSSYFAKRKLLYGFAASRLPIARAKTAILVEGYLDLLALAQAGISNVVATCGTAFTSDQARMVRRGATALVVFFDGDRAGLQAAVRACHMAMAAGLEPEVARCPEGEDPDSLLQRGGKEALEQVLAATEAYLPFLLTLVAERSPGRVGTERALRQALSSIAEVADPIRREYLLQEAAELFGIRQQALQTHLERAAARSRRRYAVPTGGGMTDDGHVGRAAAGLDGGAPPGDLPDTPLQRPPLRSFARVDVAAVEREMFAHVLKDTSGSAARVFLDERGELSLSCEEAERLAQELAEWHEENRDERPLAPAIFVQQKWHEPVDDRYRNYVSELLVNEEVPDRTDFTKAIRESLQRLRQGQRRGPR